MSHPFENTNVPVTLTGQEWFALVAKLTDKELSDKGRALCRTAGRKMAEQLATAAKACSAPTPPRRAGGAG